MPMGTKRTITFFDSSSEMLVTPEVLKAARSRTDVRITDYNLTSVDFISEARPVTTKELVRPDKICNSVLDLVGKTPMVRLSRFAEKYDLKCDLVAKCEFLSAGGSVKDRIGLLMVEEAEDQKRISPGDTLVEATSGNTGIGMSLVAAVKGYNMLITLPEKMSEEKLNTMSALGAEIIRTPTEAPWNAIESHLGLANQLAVTLPNCNFLDQYINPANPRAHYMFTAEEILYQCDNKVDMVILCVGTGGTITGTAAKIKERLPECIIVGVDPHGSILAEPESLNKEHEGVSYLVEGIGYDFIPSTLQRNYVDEWVKTDDEEGFRLARELIRLEGLMVGGSSGSAMAGVLQAAKSLKEGQRCVVLLPDSARNYMTKFMSDAWLVDNELVQKPPQENSVFGKKTVEDLKTLKTPTCIDAHESCAKAIQLMDLHKIDHLPVMQDGKVVGVITAKIIAAATLKGTLTMKDNVKTYMLKKYKSFTMQSLLAEVAVSLNYNSYVIIFNKGEFKAVLTAMDILREL